MSTEAARLIGAAMAVFALFGVGIGMGNLFSSWINSIARNPEADKKMQPIGVMGLALTESIALFAIVIAFLILFKN